MSESRARLNTIKAVLRSILIWGVLAGAALGYLVGNYMDSITSHSALESTANGVFWGAAIGLFLGLALDARSRISD